MKIDLDFDIKNLSGTSMGNASEVLANILFMSNTKTISPVKSYNMAIKIYSNKFIELDKEEANKLKEVLEKESNLPNGASAQIINVIIDSFNTKLENNE